MKTGADIEWNEQVEIEDSSNEDIQVRLKTYTAQTLRQSAFVLAIYSEIFFSLKMWQLRPNFA